jgi:parallel beta-helix repeat protein
MHRLLPSLCALLLTTTLAHAKTYEVSATSGNDGGGCGGVMRTINAGLRCLSAGDTLLIRGGTYAEILDSGLGTAWTSGTSWANPVTVRGAPGETVIVQPTSGTHVLSIQDDGSYTDSSYREYIIIDNLVLDGVNQNNTVVKFNIGSRRIRLQNSKILGNKDSNGINLGGDAPLTTRAREIEVRNTDISRNGGYGLYFGTTDNLIDGNYIHDNGGYGVHLYDEGAPTSNNTIRNNHFHHNGYTYAATPTCAMVLANGDNNVAENNLITDQKGCGVQVYGNAVRAQVIRNTIQGSSGACIAVNPGARETVIRDNVCSFAH